MKVQIIEGFKAVEESRKWKQAAAKKLAAFQTVEEMNAYLREQSRRLRNAHRKEAKPKSNERNSATH